MQHPHLWPSSWPSTGSQRARLPTETCPCPPGQRPSLAPHGPPAPQGPPRLGLWPPLRPDPTPPPCVPSTSKDPSPPKRPYRFSFPISYLPFLPFLNRLAKLKVPSGRFPMVRHPLHSPHCTPSPPGCVPRSRVNSGAGLRPILLVPPRPGLASGCAHCTRTKRTNE